MEKSFKRNITAALIVSVLTNAFLYWTDNDPAYENVWHTVYEALFLNTILFSFFFIIFISVSALKARFSGKKQS